MTSDHAHRAVKNMLGQALADDAPPPIDLGSPVDYARYRDSAVARLISEVPVLVGHVPGPGAIVLLSYVRAEPMSVILDPADPGAAIEYFAHARADALLILEVLDPAGTTDPSPRADLLTNVAQKARAAGLFPFSILVDGFESRCRWINTSQVDARLWSQLPTRRAKNWVGAPRTQAAIRTGAITVPHSARQLGVWAPARPDEQLPAHHPIDPADQVQYQIFTEALAAMVANSVHSLVDEDLPIMAATCAAQAGEVLNAYGEHRRACALDMAVLAQRAVNRTRSQLLSIAALAELLNDDRIAASTALAAIDDIATSSGRTPLSEVVRLRIADELDDAQFAQALRLADVDTD